MGVMIDEETTLICADPTDHIWGDTFYISRRHRPVAKPKAAKIGRAYRRVHRCHLCEAMLLDLMKSRMGERRYVVPMDPIERWGQDLEKMFESTWNLVRSFVIELGLLFLAMGRGLENVYRRIRKRRR